MRHYLALISLLILAGSWMNAGCGGSTSSSESSATDTVTISGSVEVPTVLNASISKGLNGGKASIIDSAAACDSVIVYQLTTGTEVGSGTCSSDGTFSIVVDKNKLKGSASDETGDTFTFRGIIKAISGDKVLYVYVGISVGSATTTISSDTIDSEATMAVADMLGNLGITDIGDIKTALVAHGAETVGLLASFDPNCFCKMQKKITESAKSSDGGLSDQTAKARDACKAYLSAGDLASVGYSNWGQFMKDCIHGDLSAVAQTEVASKIDSAGLGFSGSDWQANYSSYAGVIDKFTLIVGNKIAGEAGRADDGASGSFCGSNLEDSNYMNKMADAFLKAQDTTELEKNMDSNEGMEVMFRVFDQCKSSGDWTKCDAVEMHGILGACDGNFDKFFTSGKIDPTAVSVVHAYMGDMDTSGMTEAQKREIFIQMGDTFIGGEWSSFENKQTVYATQWRGQYDNGGSIAYTPITGDEFDAKEACVEACGTDTTCRLACFEGDEPPVDADAGKAAILLHNQTSGIVAEWRLKVDGTVKSTGQVSETAVLPSTWTVQGIVDIDGAGVKDILWRHNSSNKLYYWLLNSDGTLKDAGGSGYITNSGEDVTIGSQWQISGLAQLNPGSSSGQDSYGDIVFRNTSDNKFYRWLIKKSGDGVSVLNTCDSNGLNPGCAECTAACAAKIASSAVSAAFGVVATGNLLGGNSEPNAEILFRNSSTGGVYIWELDGNGIYSSVVTVQSPVASKFVIDAVGDVNYDGNADILWRDTSDGNKRTIWFLDSTGAVTSTQLVSDAEVSSSWEVAGIAGVNSGSTARDIIWRQTSGDRGFYGWRLNADGTFDSAYTVQASVGSQWEAFSLTEY